MASQGERWRQAAWYYVPSALVMLGLLVVWQFAVDFWQVKEYILPSPVRRPEDAVAAELPVGA